MAEITTLRKTYSTAFVLDRGKLIRIISILEQRMPEAGVEFKPTFKLKLRNGKELLLHDLQEIFGLDNAVKNPIVELDVLCGDSDTRVSLHFDSDRDSNVALVAAGPHTKWAAEVFAEIEEQVERTFSNSWIHRYVLGGSSGAFPKFYPAVLALMMSVVALTGQMLVTSTGPTHLHEPSALLQRALTATSDQEKLQIVFDKVVNDLSTEARVQANMKIDIAALLSWRNLFMVLPAIIILGALIYLGVVCYPWAVFAWGDREQEYTDVVARRNMIWTVIVVALLLGIITNLFVLTLPSFK